MAIPSAILTFAIATWLQGAETDDFNEDGSSNVSDTNSTSKAAQTVIATFTTVMIFILYNRSRTSYNRWWEGGGLLQKTRGEWFNAYSSIMAFTSTKPELQDQVEAYQHLITRLMSLLMCCGLQQVSPMRDRPFEIIDLAGFEPDSMDFLNSAPDKVEVILQWIQRSMIVHMQTGVLSAAPPILSRAFQEASRGIVNLQNARKIADFPYPYPLAQICMILQLIHYAMMPIASALALPRGWAVSLSFFSIFVLWCVHFNALDLEFPFGTRVNDLPMDSFMKDWNKSLITLLDKRATRPPKFDYDPKIHNHIEIVMSDAGELYVPKVPLLLDKGVSFIRVANQTMMSAALAPAAAAAAATEAFEAAASGLNLGQAYPESPSNDVAGKNGTRAHPESPSNDVRLATTLGLPRLTSNHSGPPPMGTSDAAAAPPKPNAAGYVAPGSTLVPTPVASNPKTRYSHSGQAYVPAPVANNHWQALPSPMQFDPLSLNTNANETLVQPRSVAPSLRSANSETACSGCISFPFLSPLRPRAANSEAALPTQKEKRDGPNE